jgi:hypothetical protein
MKILRGKNPAKESEKIRSFLKKKIFKHTKTRGVA